MIDTKNRLLFILLLVLLLSVFLIPYLLPSLNNARVLLLQTLIGLLVLAIVLFLLKSFFQKKNNLLVLIGVIGTLLLLARLLFYYAGGPITWDELYYMYLSLFPAEESSLLNRYFHIYLQRFFFLLAGWDPFKGAKIFWTFCIVTTAGFTFLNAYLLIPSKNESMRIAAGILSMLVYFSYPYILDYPGVTYADYTSMLLGSIFIFFYLQARKNQRIVYFILLGLLFFLSVKTKEVGLCLAVFLFDNDLHVQNSKTQNIPLPRSIFYLGIGFISGLFIIALNDYFLLGDSLYSFRFSSWQILLSYHTMARNAYELVDLFGALARSGVLYLLFFTLYVMYFLAKNKHLDTAHHFLWIYVVALLAFHLFSAISGARMIVIRFFIVLVPALAVLSAQIVSIFEERINGKWLLKLLLWIIICFIASLNTNYVANVLGWERNLFLERIFIPMLVLAFLILFFQEQNWVKYTQLGLFVLVFLSFFPVKLEALHNRDVENAFNRRFQPFVENSDLLTYSDDMQIFVSSDIYSTYGILGRDQESNSWMYSLLFNRNATPDQFVFDTFEVNEFINSNFTYAFISDIDWLEISEDEMKDIDAYYSVIIKDEYTFLSFMK